MVVWGSALSDYISHLDPRGMSSGNLDDEDETLGRAKNIGHHLTVSEWKPFRSSRGSGRRQSREGRGEEPRQLLASLALAPRRSATTFRFVARQRHSSGLTCNRVRGSDQIARGGAPLESKRLASDQRDQDEQHFMIGPGDVSAYATQISVSLTSTSCYWGRRFC